MVVQNGDLQVLPREKVAEFWFLGKVIIDDIR